MRAMILPAFGGPDVFKLEERPKPEPGPGELLVRVIASGTNPVDAKLRASGYWAKFTPPVVLGYDAAGVVEATGPGVKDFQRGDEVFYTPEIIGNPSGTYAEYNVVSEAIVARKPKALDFIAAAAIPLAGGTAYEALVRRLQVRVGETVLIQGAAGGVGTFAVQIARAAGARVIATASGKNQGLLRELGAEVCVDYEKQDVVEVALSETGGAGVHAVFSTLAGEVLAKSLLATRPFGRLATILGPTGDLTPLYLRNQTLHGVFLTRERRRLEELTALVEQGRLKPVVDQVLPLERVSEAHRRLDSGHGRGKVVLQVAR
jgi:NADPH2:quinone reductase